MSGAVGGGRTAAINSAEESRPSATASTPATSSARTSSNACGRGAAMDAPVSAVAFNRDYTQVGAAAGKTVKVWTLADGKEAT